MSARCGSRQRRRLYRAYRERSRTPSNCRRASSPRFSACCASSKINEMADDLKRLLEEGLLETRRHFDAVAERVEKKSDANVAELRGHIDTSVERVEKKIDDIVAR